jgi:hypothetical protein
VSERAVAGRWWHTTALTAIVGLGLTTLAPLIGLAMLIFVTPSVFLADAASGAVYAILFPLVGVATTLWYQQRHRQADLSEAGSSIGSRIRSPWPTPPDRASGRSMGRRRAEVR